MIYKIETNIIVIYSDNGESFSCVFDWPIVQVMQCFGVFIVRIRAPIGTIYNENVFIE